jgi:FKBP-type peptidyl-prolyl cis-trans isomerase
VGAVFDSNAGDKDSTFRFKIGDGTVIRGWDDGIKGMKKGGKRVIVIPAELGYGKSGAPPSIPPNSPLVFEVLDGSTCISLKLVGGTCWYKESRERKI